MKSKVLRLLFVVAIVGLVSVTAVLADDGELLRKSMSKAPGQPDTKPVSEADHAFIDMMKFYVPAQSSNGEQVEIPYIDADGNDSGSRTAAKPLIGVFIYGPVESVDGVGFVGHGMRDAYAAVSLDDGNTWKRTNLSESADLTSCDGTSEGGCSVLRKDIKLYKQELDSAYAGDVINVFQATAGANTLAVWPSRYCKGGSPNYSLAGNDDNVGKLEAIAAEMGISNPNLPDETLSPADLYLVDMFGVGGQQGSVDYSDDRFEPNQAVGEVPYSCLWAARGTLVQGDDPRTDAEETSYMRWFKAERLTSGRRDVNRVEASCVAGAGCAITWQEDPEGLRGGQGEGPGEGWSGAVANSQTDVWYSYIEWEYFNLVEDPNNDANILTLVDYETLAGDPAGDITQRPQVGIPFAMPMRVTDNAKCNVENPQPYCIGTINSDFAGEDDPIPADYGMVDLCADTVSIVTGGQGEQEICVTEYGLPLVGNIAATRPRLGLYGYDSNNDDTVDSAFVVFEAEESKGLGAYGFLPDGTPCDLESEDPDFVPDPLCEADDGKNLWYYSFNMELGGDDRGSYADRGSLDSLVSNLAGHGNMLNQPEIDWRTGDFYPPRDTAQMWNFGDYNYQIWNTEIARRGSLLAQDIKKAQDSSSGLLAMPAWKQGIMNQGGPADVMVRRIIIPNGWNANNENKGNPYAFRNMSCDDWEYGRSNQGMPENPYYPDGLCMDPAINLSGYIPDSCTDSATGESVLCPTVLEDGSSETNPVLQGRDVDEPNTTKVLTWHQCPAVYNQEGDITTVECGEDESTFDDQSWYNPLDVSKGHRGFLDGDFVMMLYAWSPNWRLNAVGNDRYELYIRRSFDGGETWTTLPSDFEASDGVEYSGDGTTTCETYRSDQTQAAGELVEPQVCNTYAAGDPEQARNVTQHSSMRTTTLDPRYATTGSPRGESITPDPEDPYELGDLAWADEDLRDPSRYFIVFETGDNTTTAEGEPEPLDLFYSRAVNFGDDYQVWAEDDDVDDCYPSDPHDDTDVSDVVSGSGFCNEFDQLEQGIPGLEASEASLEANPGGEFLYAVWAQWLPQNKNKLEESDAMARRVWYIDDYIPSDAWDFGQNLQSAELSVVRQPK